VCEEWYNYQVFAKWYEENWKPWMNSSWHIDKDILVKGNKIYSPETCCFVPVEINSLFTKNNKNRGDFPIGVTNQGKKFSARLSKSKKIRFNAGLFDTPEEAFQAYKIEKESYIKEVSNRWRSLISSKVYQAMYNYKVEITD
jgi:hypothetical protein